MRIEITRDISREGHTLVWRLDVLHDELLLLWETKSTTFFVMRWPIGSAARPERHQDSDFDGLYQRTRRWYRNWRSNTYCIGLEEAAQPMKVLIACEFSGTVRDAFLARGHDAMSCDLLDTEAQGPHYKGDVRDVIGRGGT